MPKTCVAVGCTNHNMMMKKLSFHKFPKDENRCKLWVSALKRDKPDGTPWQPSKHSVICNEHFISGQVSSDPSHPDFIPSVFSHNSKSNTKLKQDDKLKRYSRKKRPLAASTPVNESESCSKRPKISPRQLCPEDNEMENIDPRIYIAEPVTPPQHTGVNRPLPPSEREAIYSEMDNLRAEKHQLQQDYQVLNSKYQLSSLKASSVENDNIKCKFYTGLTWDVFFSLFTFLSQFVVKANSESLQLQDQLFLTLVKLRLDLPFEHLAHQCGVANSTVNDIYWKWINLMHAKLSFLVHWPDRETIHATLPGVFRSKFPRLTCIIDCFETFIDRPKNLKARAQVYSNYKKHSTVKVLIGCSPLGSITFLSQAWGGRVSDVELVRQSGFINRNFHHPGDQILADRGFTLEDDFASQCSAELITPAFTKGKKQLLAKDIEISRKISSVRIHIERVIGLLKNRYTILKGTIPVVMIKSLSDEANDSEFASVDKTLQVCAALTNMGDGIVYSED